MNANSPFRKPGVRLAPRLACLATIVAVLWLGIAPGPVLARDSTNDTASVTAGRRLYEHQCYFCHGYSGRAQTTAARYLHPKPRDFTQLNPGSSDRESMIQTVTHGRPGTAMAAFGKRFTGEQIEQVVDYIRHAFMTTRTDQAGYHTPANGWPDHERYRAAFPFALGRIKVDDPAIERDPGLNSARQLFMSSCISCHEASSGAADKNSVWQIQAVTYPPDYYLLAEWGVAPPDERFDPHHRHEHAPEHRLTSAIERRGKALYASNCASCHAANGSGRNWRGSFILPSPPDFRLLNLAQRKTSDLVRRILNAPPGTSMPAFQRVLAPEDAAAIASYMQRAFAHDPQSVSVDRPHR